MNAAAFPETPVKIALVQLTSGNDIDGNLATIAQFVEAAAEMGADAVFLPECCALMQTSRAQLRASAEQPGDGLIQRTLSALSSKYHVQLYVGSLPLASDDPDRVFNTSMVFTPDGDCVARYDKVHLFDVSLENGEQYLESAYPRAGNTLVALPSNFGHVGLSICYDLRFPELYRNLATQGAEILLVPSAFSVTTGDAHWHILLRARAIENSCYVIAAAQWGTHPSGRKTYGHSIVIDPWGRVVAEKPSGTGLLMSAIDRNEIQTARRQLPSLEHRRSWL